jgi:hypothetical protein
MSAAIVFGLVLPRSSMKSFLWIPPTKASVALSSDTFSAEFLMIFHLCIYVLIESSYFCRHALYSSIDTVFLHVEKKFLTNRSSKVSQLSIDLGGNFLIHDLVAPLRYTWILCIAIALSSTCQLYCFQVVNQPILGIFQSFEFLITVWQFEI